MKNDFSALPDAEKHPAATAVTPQQIRDSENAIRAAASPEARIAAEAAHQALCQTQTDQLRAIFMQHQFQQLTHNAHES